MKKTTTLNGTNTQRWIAISIAVIFLLIGLLYFDNLKFLVLLPILFSITILLLIQFPRLTINQRELVYEKIGIVMIFSHKEVFLFDEIEQVKFVKGDGKISLMNKLLIQRNTGYGPRVRSDQMIINFRNGKKRILNRINSREKFKWFVGEINKELKN